MSLGLKKNINNFAVLINGPPQIMLLPVYLHEHFIDVEGIAVASMLSFKSFSVNRAEFDPLKTERLSGYGDASLRLMR